MIADELRSKCMETIQHYYSESLDNGQIGRLEILPISLNSVDVLKMKASNSIIEDAPGGNSELMKSSTYQDIIMKTAFYCNQDYYQVKFYNRLHLHRFTSSAVSQFYRSTEYHEPLSLQFERDC